MGPWKPIASARLASMSQLALDAWSLEG